VLLAWPEPIATQLYRQLQPFRPQLDVTLVPSSQAGDYLHEPGYYQALYVTPEMWRSLAHRWRQRRDAATCLVVLGPGPASAAYLAEAASALYMPSALDEAGCAALFTDLHQALRAGWPVVEAVAASAGRLALAGAEPAWPAATTIAAGSASPSVASVAGENACAVQQTVVSNQGIVVGAITVQGDQVHGNKVVYQAGGDQVNITRSGAAPAKLAQDAAGDQVNVSRASHTLPVRRCPQCKELVRPTDRFCQSCGRQMDQVAL
jgi:hypothetical protein